MSAAEASPPTIQIRRAGRALQKFGTLVVCGGGCYGSYYVRQLLRASAAGAVRWDRLVVVDRDPRCRVILEGAALANAEDWQPGTQSSGLASAGVPPRRQDRASATEPRHHSPAPRVVLSHWTEFFDRYLGDAVGRAARNPDDSAGDAIVPSPLMPHLMFEWLVRRARDRWPARRVTAESLMENPGLPWHRHAEAATYVSFAEWMCPINCIEPARCPETRGPRDWSVAHTVREYVEQAGAAAVGASPLAGPALLECTHRAYGVGMFDTADVVRADAIVAEAGARGDARVLVGTVSQCHGALGVLHVES